MEKEKNRWPLVSIVIPVYNAEKDLERCLSSVLLQDYYNIEVILVDDGSKDSSPEICRKYKNQYPERILFVSQQNGGPSAARNAGIDLSRGKYVTFVDSDDVAAPNMVSTMVEKAEGACADVVICAYWKNTKNGETVRTYALPEGLYSGKDQKKVLYSLLDERPGDVPPYSWVRMIRKSILDEKQLRFNTRLYRSEDYHFWVKVHSAIEKVYLLSKTPLYHYYDNDTSITHKHVNGYWNDVKFIYDDLQGILKDDPRLFEKLNIMFVKRSLIALNNATFCKRAKDARSEIRQVLSDEELRGVISKTNQSDIVYYSRYRFLMSKDLKCVIIVKYMMRWLKSRKYKL